MCLEMEPLVKVQILELNRLWLRTDWPCHRGTCSLGGLCGAAPARPARGEPAGSTVLTGMLAFVVCSVSQML